MDPRRAAILGASCLLAAALPAQQTRADVIERVVAVVNDDPIFLSELRRHAAPLVSGTRATHAVHETYAAVLEHLIDQTLFAQAARADAIVVADADVERAIDTVRANTRLPTTAAFWQAVAQQGFGAPDEYRAELRAQLLRFRVLDARMGSWTSITEDDVRRRYDELVRAARGAQAATIPPYASARSAIEIELREASMERRATALITELRRAATIERRLDGSRAMPVEGAFDH